MSTPVGDARRHAPATLRNRAPLLAVLRRALPPAGDVLEVAAGTGEHAAFFAAALPALAWQPTDLEGAALASIAAHREAAGLPNLRPPLPLDAASWPWPVERADAVVAINMIHIAPWQATLGLLRGAAALLPPGGPLVLYGPYRREGRHTAPSNEAFDRALRRQDPAWGVRDIEAVEEAAAERGLGLAEIVEMPANNLVLVLRRAAPP
jgi:SAM-dependent methyltransferase